MMNFEEKRRLAMQELDNAHIWKSNYYPPFIRMLHLLGYKVPLPHYNSFLNNALSTGLFFGLLWGGMMYVLIWRAQAISLNVILLTSVFAGASFGLILASYYKYGFKKHQLTPWDQIGHAKSIVQ
jgi:hypothetical protein